MTASNPETMRDSGRGESHSALFLLRYFVESAQRHRQSEPSDVSMFRLFEDGSRGSRVLRVRQRADSNAHEPWQVVGLPKDRRSTFRAKKVVNVPAACG
jgi:hypothetical protein